MKIIFLNPQGNFDSRDSHWTKHQDFGGQLVYVKEIALALSKKGIKVDIITRKFRDEELSGFDATFDGYGGNDDVRIIRIPCGPAGFLRKELLWPHLAEWCENIAAFYASENEMPDFITGHYGDGGIAAVMLSRKWEGLSRLRHIRLEYSKRKNFSGPAKQRKILKNTFISTRESLLKTSP